MLRCAPPPAVTRHITRPAPARIVTAAGRVAVAPGVLAKRGIAVAPRRRLHRRGRCSVVHAEAAVDLQSSAPPPPLALLAGVTRHCLEVDYGGRKVIRHSVKAKLGNSLRNWFRHMPLRRLATFDLLLSLTPLSVPVLPLLLLPTPTLHPQIKIETGEIARQANGAVTLTDGETIVLATACAKPAPDSSSSSSSSSQHQTGDGSFVPLQVNYFERFSAAGRTTGSFFKRDGRPKDSETLVSRLVDRPLRPNFAKGWSAETQVLIWVVSYDGEHSPEPLAITAAGAALAVSDIPLTKAVVGARVALLPVSLLCCCFLFFSG